VKPGLTTPKTQIVFILLDILKKKLLQFLLVFYPRLIYEAVTY